MISLFFRSIKEIFRFCIISVIPLKTTLLIIQLLLFSAVLKAQNCTVNANVDVSYCANQTIQLAGTVSSAVAGYTSPITWTQVGGPSVVISNPNIANPTIQGATPNRTYTFRLTAICEDEETVFDEVKITVKPITIANSGADATYCPGTYSVTGNTPLNAGETVSWAIVGSNSAGITLSSSTITNPTITLAQTSAGSTTLRYNITSTNGCVVTDDVVITNRGGVPAVNAGFDQNIASNVACYSVSTCANLVGTFEGNGTGGQIGTWSQVSGPTIATFNDVNAQNPQVCNLKQGTYVFRLTATGPCVNGSDEVTVVVPPASQSITQAGAMADISFCDGRTSVVLNGTVPSFTGETVLWTIVTNGGGTPVIVSTTSPTTTVTGLVSGAYYQFRYTITNAATGCSTTNTVQVYNQTTPSINAGVDQILACNTTTVSLPYTQGGGLYTQYQIISGPSGVMASPADATASPQVLSGLIAGDYIVRFTRNSPPSSTCQTATDDVRVTVSATPSGSNAGTDQVLACGVTNTSLAGNTPSLGKGKWSQVSGPSVAVFSNNTSSTSGVSNLLTGDYTFRWTIDNGPNCPKTFDDVLVIVRIPPVADAGVDQITVCVGTSVQLKANAPLRRQVGTWTVVGQSPAGTAPIFTNVNNPNAKIKNLIANTTYQLQWTMVSTPQTGAGGCATASDIVVIMTNNSPGPGDANAGVDICAATGSTSVALGATAPASPYTGTWTNVSKPAGSATPNYIPSASLATAQATGLQTGTYKFVWTITDGVCSSNDTVQVTVNSAIPTASAGATQTLCGTSATLAGNSAGAGIGTWTQVSGPSQANIVDVNSPSTVVNSLVSGDYVFRWTITNGSCTNGTQADVTIKVSDPISVANIAAASLQVCPTANSVAITADAINAASTGAWSVVGNTPSAVSFSSNTSPTTTVSGLVQGNYKLRWTVSGGANCPVTSDDIDIFVQESSNAGVDQNLCLSNSATLAGNGPSGTWTKVSGPGTQTITPTASPSNVAVVTGLTTGQYVFTYTIIKNASATTCPAPIADQVILNVSAAGSTPNAGADKQFCEATVFNLNQNSDVTPNPVPAGQTGQWTLLSQPVGSNATFVNATLPTAALNLSSGSSKYGLYLLKWTITNGTCVIGDEVRIENFQTPTVANAGVDKTVCPPTVKMTGNVPTVGQGMWTLVSKTPTTLPTPTILNPQVATTDISGIDASGSYTFRWTISNGPCTVSTNDIIINVPDPAPTTANAGIDQTICNGTAANIIGNTPTVGTGAWSKTTDSPYSVFSPASGTSPATTALSLSPGTYKYIWTITSGQCISRDTMIINNLAVPSTANAGVDQIVCQFSPVNLNATVPTAGTGTWSQISRPAANPNATFLSPNSPTSQVVGTDLGQYTFRWTVSTGINSPNDCQTSFDDIVVNIVAAPTPAVAGASQVICEGQTLTMAGNAPAVGTGTWTKVAGPSGTPEIITNVNSPTTTVTGLLAGTYKFRWTIGASGNCTSFDEMTVTVRPKPTLSSATPSCVGGAGTGVITVTGVTNPTGGTLNYALNTGSFQTSNVFNNLANGAYTITIKDVTTGCTNTTTTNVSCTDNPVIGLAKSAGTPVLVTNGVYDVPYTITARNLGNVALANVQVTDNLNTTFASPITYSIPAKSTTSPLTINSAFDGNTNQNLLTAASSTLAIGATQTINFTVRVNLNGSTQTLFNNSASAGATNASGTVSSPTDISNNGGPNAIDPNVNGNPKDFGEDTPTPVNIVNGNIGVAKSAGTPTKVSDGVYDVPYTVTVKNIGNVTLTSVQVSDDLSTTFPSPATYTISQAPQTLAPLSAETTFNGTSAMNLLLVNASNTSTLTAGQARTITFTVQVTLNGSTQTIFNNQTTATGTNPTGSTVADLSNNGLEAAIDPNSNGFAGDNGENTPTPVTISNPIIGVAKSVVGSPTLKTDGSYDVVYQVITKNYGNVTLNNVQITENLATTFPSPLTYSITAKSGATDINAGFSGTPSAQNLLTGSGTLAPNATNTYSFTVNIKLNGYTGSNTFLNNVTASGTGTTGGSTSDVSNNGTDPTPMGSTSTPITIQNQADLSLSKTVSKTTPNVGENITYTITVNNAGPNTATNVEVKDVLPAGLQFVSSSSLTNVAGTLTGTIPSIAVNGSASVTFVAKVLSAGLTTNAAELSKADQPDLDSPHGNGTTNTEDDRSSVDINAQQADLSLTKTVSNTNPNVGSNITYTITVSNAGPSIATNVQVKDVLPAGLTFVSSGTPAASNFTNTSGTLLSNNIATIPVNGSVTLTFVATVTQAGSILNKAEVSKTDQYDPDSQPNTGTEDGQDDTGGVLIGGQQADLSLQKSVSNTNPNVGDVVTYTITVSNAGPSTATNVTIQDILPAGLQFVSSANLTNTLGTLTNTTPMTVLVGTPINLTFTAKILTPTASNLTAINNKAEIKSADQFDPDSQPNTGTADGQDDTDDAPLTIQTADLSLVKNASPLSVNVGDNVTYSIVISNAGTNTATNVEVKDLLPTGLQLVSSTDFTASGQTLTASGLTIASGTSKTLTYIAKVTASGALKNGAEVTKSDQYDPDSQPNTGTTDGQDDTGNITVAGKLADLSLVKTVNNSVVNTNDIVTFTITVSNGGPNAVTTGTVSDALPVGLEFVSSSTLTNNNGILQGTFTNLQPNTSLAFTFQAKVTGTGTITNKAQIASSDVPDPDSTPNNGTDNGEDDTENEAIRVRQADLELTKTVSNSNPNVGSNITYTITVINKGTDNATNVKVKDILPAGLTFVSSTDFVNTSGTLISNNIPSITAGGQQVLTFVATVTQVGSILNKAEVSASDQFDPDSQPNTGTEDGQDDTGGVLIGGQQADLSLTKAVSNTTGTPTAPNVGDNVTYTIKVSNAGPSVATNVEVRDVLPAGISFVSSSDFTNTSGTLTATVGSIPVGTPTVLTFIGKITGNQAIINQVEISKSDQFDPDSQPNTGTSDGQDDTGSATVTPKKSDLSLTKTVSNTAPNVNSNITYTINVTNAGPDIATNVEVKDILPAGLQFVSSADLTNTSGTLTGTADAIAIGATKSFNFVAKVLNSSAILNRAEVSKADQYDPDSQPNTGTADGQDDTGGVLIGGQQADLSLAKAVSNSTGTPAAPNVGDNVTYTITLTNAGPSIATNVEVKDILPTGLSFVSSTDFTNLNGTLTSQISNLPIGTRTLTFVAQVSQPVSITNKAEVSKSDQFDPDSQPNTGTEDGQDDTGNVTLTPKTADLSLTKSVSKTNPNVGENIIYTITVKNVGPDAATNVQVKDVLPTGLTFVSSTDFTNTSGVLFSNNIPTISSGGIVTLTFVAKVTQAGAILNKAEISKSDVYDIDSQPNTGTEDGQDDTGGVLIGGQQADLSLTKAVSNSTPNVGETITYTITVNNVGPSVATGVEVKDVLPFGLDFIGSIDFTNTAGVLTASNLTIAVGTPKTLTFIAKVTASSIIINKTEILKSDQFDPDSQVNTGTDDGQDDIGNVTITPQVADLSLKKLASPLSANVGDNITYTIQVSNAGPSTATNVEVKDILPAGLSLVNAGNFTDNAGTLTATIPSLAAGVTQNLTFTAKLTQAGNVTNAVEITKSDQFDPDSQVNNGTTNNEDDTDKITVGGVLADLSILKTVDKAVVNPNENVEFTIVITNEGPSAVSTASIRDVLPTGLQFVSSSNFANVSGTLTGQVSNLGVNQSQTFKFIAKVTGTSKITNNAEIASSNVPDPDSSPNNGILNGEDDTDSTSVRVRAADLSLQKFVSNANANVGDEVEFTLLVNNAGADAATNVQVKDVLPAGLQFTSSTDFSLSSGVLLSNNITTVPVNGSTSLKFKAKITASGTITNKAEIIKSDQFDPDSQPNTGTEDGQDDVGAISLNGQQADLSLTKAVSNTTPNVGDNITYTITVNNAGPSTATNVEVRDVLPAGITFVSSADFTNVNGTLTATVGSIAVGTPKVLTFVGQVSQPAITINKAEISKSDQFDPDSQPNSGTTDGQDDTGSATITPKQSDLSLTKAVSNTAPNVNTNVTYTINVTNAGPDIATNVEVKDVLPAGLQFISSSDLTNNARTVTGTTQTIAVGGTKTFTFVAKVLTSNAILNKAEVSKSDQFDPDSQPNTGTTDGQDDTGGVLIGGQQADLSLQKSVSNTTGTPAAPNVGENVNYTIIVTNAGPSTATNVEVKDVLPAGLQFVSSSDFQLSGSTLTSQITSLAVGTKTLSFIAKVTGNQTITNKAEISKSDQFDPNSQPNTGTEDGQDDTDSVSVKPRIADLSLEKLVSKTNPNVGETITYTIKVKNAGPDNATNVQVKDVLPPGLSFVSSTDFINTSGLLLSNNIASVTAGGEVSLSFQATVTQSGAILNKAEVSKSDQFDPDSQPNTGTEDGQDDTGGVLIGGQQADLSLTKAVSNTTPNVGDNVTYTITVTNAGPSTATNVEVRDVLPAGLSFVSTGTPAGSDFINTNGTLTGAISSLSVGNPRTLTFTAKVTGSQTIINKAEVSKSDQFDPDSQVGSGTEDGQDDTGSASLTPQSADLSLLKTVSKTNPTVGENITYTISVTNESPNVATNVEVKDVLPVGLQFVSSSDFTNNAGTLTGTIANITLGATRSLSFVARVTQAGAIINKAEVSKSDQFDPDSQPNTGTTDGQDDTGGVLIGGQQADLSLQKSVSNTTGTPAVPNVGDNVTYTITVTNAGPSTATNVEVKDVLPAGLQFVSSSDFQLSGSTLTSQIASLAVGTKTLSFIAKVTGNQTITNKAEISKSDQFDPNSQPNTGTEDGQDDTGGVSLTPKVADLSLAKLVSKTNPNVGETITYTIKVKNAGPDNATNVQVKDVLPAGLSFVSSSDFTLSSGNTLTSNNIASVTSGGEVALTFLAKPLSSGLITNQAEIIKSDQFDPDSQVNNGVNNNEDDTDGITIGGQQVDLSLQKDVDNSSPNVGDIVTYSIMVLNAGPSLGTGVEVKDILPAGLQFVSSTDFTNRNDTLTTSSPLTLSIGTPRVLTFKAKVLTPTSTNYTIVNKAEISKADQVDGDSQPNTGTEDGQDDTDNAILTIQRADLRLQKTVSKINPNVGESVTYTISVTNEGPNTATNVEVKDVLPTGLDFVSSSSLTNSNATLTGTIINIPVGVTRSVTFVAKVTQSGAILNKAEVSKADQFDPDSQPNTGTEDGQDDTGGVLIGGQQADLSLTKTVDNARPNVGENITYTISVSNNGPSDATNVEVRDVLPAGLQFVSSSDFTSQGSILLAEIPTLSNGAKKVLTFVAKVIGSQKIVNKAEISKADQFDPNSQPNTGTEDGQNDTDSTVVKPQVADLSLTKTVSNQQPNVGDEIIYTITVKNAGTDPATNVQVRDILPTGVTFVSSNDFTFASGGILTSNNIAQIAVSRQAVLTFKAKVMASGSITNKAQITKSDQFDPDSQPNNGTDNNEDDTEAVTIGGQQADLSLNKDIDKTNPNVGDIVTYSITVNNAGPSIATGVEVKDILPAGLQFVSSTDFIANADTLKSQIGTIQIGTPKVVTFKAKVLAPINNQTTIINAAEISKADQQDPDSQVNSGTTDGQDDTGDASLTIQTADLKLLKTVSNPSPTVGSTVMYSITVTNEGSSAATNVEITDVLPAGLKFVSSLNFVENPSGTLKTTIANLASGTNRTITFIAKVTQPGVIINKAEITKSDQFDPDSQPNTGTEDGQDDTGGVTIGGQQADLSLKKLVSNATPNVGEDVAYTIEVTNSGPSTANNVEVKDLLPAGLQFVSSSDFIQQGSTLTAQIPNIANGEKKAVTFVAKIVQSVNLTNKAEIWSQVPYWA